MCYLVFLLEIAELQKRSARRILKYHDDRKDFRNCVQNYINSYITTFHSYFQGLEQGEFQLIGVLHKSMILLQVLRILQHLRAFSFGFV